MLAIREASRVLGSWRMEDCTLYVTLEPCPMCTGAVINARIGRVVYGAKDAKAGACGSVIQMDAYPLNHRLRAEGGVMAQQCAALLSEFFEKKRSHKNNAKENEHE
jgi:tRNA(adenine34) deaminase